MVSQYWVVVVFVVVHWPSFCGVFDIVATYWTLVVALQPIENLRSLPMSQITVQNKYTRRKEKKNRNDASDFYLSITLYRVCIVYVILAPPVSLYEQCIQTTAIFWCGETFTLTKVQNAHTSLLLALWCFQVQLL